MLEYYLTMDEVVRETYVAMKVDPERIPREDSLRYDFHQRIGDNTWYSQFANLWGRGNAQAVLQTVLGSAWSKTRKTLLELCNRPAEK